jgi:DNA polymerase IV
VKSIGTETTFPEDLVDGAAIEREVRRLADSTGTRLRKAARTGRTVTLKLRFGDFRTITRSVTLAEPTDDTAVLATRAVELVRGVAATEGLDRGVRLLGVTASNLAEPQAAQGSLFYEGPAPSRLDAVVDDLRSRFGDRAVARAGDGRASPGPRGTPSGAARCDPVGGARE